MRSVLRHADVMTAKQSWLNKVLCHGAFSCGGVWLMTAQFCPVVTKSINTFGQCGHGEKKEENTAINIAFKFLHSSKCK